VWGGVGGLIVGGGGGFCGAGFLGVGGVVGWGGGGGWNTVLISFPRAPPPPQ